MLRAMIPTRLNRNEPMNVANTFCVVLSSITSLVRPYGLVARNGDSSVTGTLSGSPYTVAEELKTEVGRAVGFQALGNSINTIAIGTNVVAGGESAIGIGAGFAGLAEGGDAAGVFVLQGEGPAGQAERIGAVGAGAEVPLGAERGAPSAEAAEAAGGHAFELAGFAAAGLQGEAAGGVEPFAGQAAQGGFADARHQQAVLGRPLAARIGAVISAAINSSKATSASIRRCFSSCCSGLNSKTCVNNL